MVGAGSRRGSETESSAGGAGPGPDPSFRDGGRRPKSNKHRAGSTHNPHPGSIRGCECLAKSRPSRI
uniref:Uncharacterized protein n=1 Tax=Human herpesvirus 2 TaxID=10310 RepID=A0A481TBB8_HHV2|nr:hypothetical protein [Human alphaherpesvirus 2]